MEGPNNDEEEEGPIVKGSSRGGSAAVDDAVVGGGWFEATMSAGNTTMCTLPTSPHLSRQDGEAVNTSTTRFSPATATASVAASKTITQPSTPSQSADTQPTAASPTDASRRSSPRRDPSASVLEIRTRVNLRTLADVESGCKQDTSGLPKGP